MSMRIKGTQAKLDNLNCIRLGFNKAALCALFIVAGFSCGYSQTKSSGKNVGIAAKSEPKTGIGDRGRYWVVFDKQSPYSRVIVLKYDDYTCLVFSDPDGGEQTCISSKDPSNPAHEYIRYMSVGLAAMDHPKKAAMIGLGGGSAVHMLRRAAPGMMFNVIEIDPAVIEAAGLFFGMQSAPDLNIAQVDGREFIKGSDKKWDIILLDAFGNNFIPFHLTTQQFLSAVRSRLEQDGVVVSNVWRTNMRLFRAMVKTYAAVFERVFVFPCQNTGNAIILGAMGKSAQSCEGIEVNAERLSKELNLPFDIKEAPSVCKPADRIRTDDVPALSDDRPEEAQELGATWQKQDR